MSRKMDLWTPILVLTILLAAALGNGFFLKSTADRWQDQLKQTESAAAAGDWDSVRVSLDQVYQDWEQHQTYLHIVSDHETTTQADILFSRLRTNADLAESGFFLRDLAELQEQLRDLASAEQLSIRNIL